METLEDLKAYGSFSDVRQQIKGSLGEKITLKFSSWEELLTAIQELKGFLGKARKELSEKDSESSKSNTTSLYFQSEAARIIYALLRLDGEQRLKELGVDKSHVRNLEKAKSWRNNIAKIIHPDVCNHPEASEASAKLTKLYQQMIGK